MAVRPISTQVSYVHQEDDDSGQGLVLVLKEIIDWVVDTQADIGQIHINYAESIADKSFYYEAHIYHSGHCTKIIKHPYEYTKDIEKIEAIKRILES